MSNKAFTLIEILIVVFITALLMGPVYMIYRSGMRSSVSGIVSLDMQSEGERILLQLHHDLKNSCVPFDGDLVIRFSDMLKSEHTDTSSLEGLQYSFYAFASDEADVISQLTASGKALRPARRITYSLERSERQNVMALYRAEHSRKGGTVKRRLSERVNFFQISPVSISSGTDDSNQFLWQVTLQLAELPQSLPPSSQLVLSNRARGIIIADFYDVVYSDFFNDTQNFPFMNRNWYSGIAAVD